MTRYSAVQITSPLGRSGLPGRIRIVARGVLPPEAAAAPVRFFVDGRGCFYLHLDDKVYAVVCEAGDLLSVPTGTRHWFDMGVRPTFCAIRFFQKDDGWVGDFTGDPIASRIPDLDELYHTCT